MCYILITTAVPNNLTTNARFLTYSSLLLFLRMPEFTKENGAALSQDFFDSLDHVDEGALSRLIVEYRLNTLQELPDLRSLFLTRRKPPMAYSQSQYYYQNQAMHVHQGLSQYPHVRQRVM